MSKKAKIFIALGFLVIITVFVIVTLKKSKGGQIEVQVDKVKRGDITKVVSGSGKIKPETEVKISANVSGEIIGLFVKEGDRIPKGKLLVELDRKRYEAALEHAKSNVKSSEANLSQESSELKRAQDLFSRNLLSLAGKEAAEAKFKYADANVDQARAILDQAQDELSKTRIFSPMEGIVTQLNKESGEIALGSTFQADVIMVVADLTKMEVVVDIDENDVVSVAISDTSKIEVDAIQDTVLKGIVSEIAHSATTRGFGTQEEVTNFEVKIAIINPMERLRPGMSATVDIETETHDNILHVPLQAVTVRTPEEIEGNKDKTKSKAAEVKDEKKESVETSTGKKSDGKKAEEDKLIEIVFVVKNDSAKIVPVKTGISNDTDIEILSGVQEDEQVVTGSYRTLTKVLKNGSPVKIAAPKGKNEKAEPAKEK